MKKEFKCNCESCGKDVTIIGSEDQWNDLVTTTKNIQDIFPDLSADDREILISGICGSCYDKLFSEDD